MSELEPVFVDRNGCIVANELGELYMKSEADKVISGLEEEIRNLRHSLIDARHEVAKARGKKSSNKHKVKFKEGK